jgi:methyltransferase (TIGR00027 family)
VKKDVLPAVQRYAPTMREGHASRTAVLVCMGRAVGHKTGNVKRFSDPTARELLPDDAKARLDRFDPSVRPKGLRARLYDGYLRHQSRLMVARTVAIDDAVRTSGASQLVILGAGLDGRAWRMDELRDVVVFEVDHPDTQRDKRARVSRLTPASTDIRFVPVDFTRDSLDEALAKAGHDATRPTVWIWEGVVMYLTRADVEATLRIVARRSAPGSRVVVTYHAPTPMRWIVGFVVGRLGEPLRSVFRPAEMAALLVKHGFAVVRDDGIPAISATLSDDEGARSRFTSHFRVATADRGGRPPRKRDARKTGTTPPGGVPQDR